MSLAGRLGTAIANDSDEADLRRPHLPIGPNTEVVAVRFSLLHVFAPSWDWS
jgi:hypothetical protein